MKPPKLVALTSPQIINDETGEPFTAEQFIVYMARVSNPSNQNNVATAQSLLRYLLKNQHWSPFDMIHMTCEITTSRAIMAQVLRHWSFRFQEFSQRYAKVPSARRLEDWSHVEARFKHVDGNRQGSDEGESPMGLSHCAQASCAESSNAYEFLTERGVAPECARMVLPLATLTTAYMTGSVRSWMTYFWQRLDSHAQKEHRQMASLLFDIFRDNFPEVAQLVATNRPSVVEVSPDWLP